MKILYANGDSFTEGSELGNEQFNFNTERYGTNYSKLICKKLTVAEHPMKDEHLAYLLNNSYPALLSKKLKCDNYINNAIGGSSCQSITKRTIADLAKLMERYDPQDIFVVIGWTIITSSELAHYDTKYEYYQFTPAAVAYRPDYPDFNKYQNLHHVVSSVNLGYMVTTHLYQILFLQNFLKLHGIKYMFTYGLNPFPKKENKFVWNRLIKLNTDSDIKKRYREVRKNKLIEVLFSQIDFNQFFLGETDASSLKNFLSTYDKMSFQDFCLDNYLPMGKDNHPLELGHEIWSSILYNHVKNVYNKE